MREERALAGTTYSIDVISGDPALGEVARLKGVVSEWQADSEISRIASAAHGRPVAVSAELYGVINRALWFAERTGGALDPSFAGCAAKCSIPKQRITVASELADCRQHTGFDRILLDPMAFTVALGEPGMKIGLGDIRLSAGDLAEPWPGPSCPTESGNMAEIRN